MTIKNFHNRQPEAKHYFYLVHYIFAHQKLKNGIYIIRLYKVFLYIIVLMLFLKTSRILSLVKAQNVGLQVISRTHISALNSPF